MGILDNKTRLLDTLLTLEGRRQLASGKMRIEFVSFTDSDTFYEADLASGSVDPSDRLFLEAASLPHDQIVFEADDAGRLMPYRGSDLGVIDGKIVSSSNGVVSIVTGSEFTSLSERLLASSVNNFQKLYAIRTDDAINNDEREFSTNTDSLTFNITTNTPFSKREVKMINVEQIESLFQDKRLSHVPNFQYLPPVNASAISGGDTTSLGLFPQIGQRKSSLTYDEIVRDLKNKEHSIIEFNPTSLQNNIVCQLFEAKQDLLQKLEVIDFGDIITNDELSPEKRVFFVGKVFIDNFGAQTFVNIFTLVFE